MNPRRDPGAETGRNRATRRPVLVSDTPMRLSWFSPLPPHRSGIAAYSADLLPALAARHRIDAYVDDGRGAPGASAATAVPGVAIRGAYDFSWAHPQAPPDVIVYQLGNDVCHDYMWPYMVRYPGLIVMHDAQLHQARAQGLLARHRDDDYVAEFHYNYPESDTGLAKLVIAGLGGSLYYLWPMLRIPIEAARLVAVHSRWLVSHLAEECPGANVVHIRMGVPDPLLAATTPPAEIRRRHQVPADAVVFAAFGRVTPEKGLTRVLMALAQVGDAAGRAHLLCVGDTTAYYDLLAEAREVGLADRVHITGYVADPDLPSYLAAADVCLSLRWPTSRETSASWLRCVAAGKPTVINDLVHTTDLPTLDVRSMTVQSSAGSGAAPVAVAIELVDDINMLRVALRRLTEDAALRARLGDAARAHWQAHATVETMARDYEDALARAVSLPAPEPPAGWPAHLTRDGTEKTRALAGRIGTDVPFGSAASARRG